MSRNDQATATLAAKLRKTVSPILPDWTSGARFTEERLPQPSLRRSHSRPPARC